MAITGSTLTALDYVVKRMFWKGKVVNATEREYPLLAKLSKIGRFGGSDLKIPITHSTPPSYGATFSAAKATRGAPDGEAFILTRSVAYSYHEFDGVTMMAMKDDEMSFVRSVSQGLSMLRENWLNAFAFYLYGDGHGDLAVVSGTPSANVITLSNRDDARKFEIGMFLEIRDTTDATRRTGTTTLEGTTAFYTVTAVDEDAGTITVDDDQNVADTDVIFRYDTRDAVVTGLDGWIPSSAPTSTAFFGVDRTVHPTRLAGHRVDGSGGELKEAIRELAARIHDRKGRPKWGFMNSTNFTTLEQELETKVMREDGGDGKYGFSAIDMVTPAGTIRFYPDPNAPADKIYLIDPRHIGIKHLGDVPHMINDDGQLMARTVDEDGVEVRARGVTQMWSNFPGAHGVVHSIGS